MGWEAGGPPNQIDWRVPRLAFNIPNWKHCDVGNRSVRHCPKRTEGSRGASERFAPHPGHRFDSLHSPESRHVAQKSPTNSSTLQGHQVDAANRRAGSCGRTEELDHAIDRRDQCCRNMCFDRERCDRRATAGPVQTCRQGQDLYQRPLQFRGFWGRIIRHRRSWRRPTNPRRWVLLRLRRCAWKHSGRQVERGSNRSTR